MGESTFRSSQEKLRKEETVTVNGPHGDTIDVKASFRPKPVDANTIKLIVKDLYATNSIGSDGIT